MSDKQISDVVENSSRAEKLTESLLDTIVLGIEDSESPLLFSFRDSIFLINRMSKKEFRKMATAIIQKMDSDDKLEDHNQDSGGSSPSSSNAPTDSAVDKDENDKDNTRAEKPSKRSSVDEVPSNTETDVSEEIRVSFQVEDGKSFVQSIRENPGSSEPALKTTKMGIDDSQEQICREHNTPGKDSCFAVDKDENDKDNTRAIKPSMRSSVDEVPSNTETDNSEEIRVFLHVEDGKLFVQSIGEFGIGSENPGSSEPAQKTTKMGIDDSQEQICREYKDSCFAIELVEIDTTVGASFTSGKENVPESADSGDMCVQSRHSELGIGPKNQISSKPDLKTLEMGSDESVLIDDIDSTKVDEKMNRILSISTESCPDGAWPKIGSSGEIEAIPITEIKSEESPDAAMKYFMLERPSECIVIRISADLENVLVSAVKYKHLSAATSGGTIGECVTGSDRQDITNFDRVECTAEVTNQDNFSKVQGEEKNEENVEIQHRMKMETSERESTSTNENGFFLSDPILPEEISKSDHAVVKDIGTNYDRSVSESSKDIMDKVTLKVGDAKVTKYIEINPKGNGAGNFCLLDTVEKDSRKDLFADIEEENSGLKSICKTKNMPAVNEFEDFGSSTKDVQSPVVSYQNKTESSEDAKKEHSMDITNVDTTQRIADTKKSSSKRIVDVNNQLLKNFENRSPEKINKDTSLSENGEVDKVHGNPSELDIAPSKELSENVESIVVEETAFEEKKYSNLKRISLNNEDGLSDKRDPQEEIVEEINEEIASPRKAESVVDVANEEPGSCENVDSDYEVVDEEMSDENSSFEQVESKKVELGEQIGVKLVLHENMKQGGKNQENGDFQDVSKSDDEVDEIDETLSLRKNNSTESEDEDDEDEDEDEVEDEIEIREMNGKLGLQNATKSEDEDEVEEIEVELKSDEEDGHSKNFTKKEGCTEKTVSACSSASAVEMKKQKFRLQEIQILSDSDCGYTEKEMLDISSPFVINTDMEKCSQGEDKAKTEVSWRLLSPLNEETNEEEIEADLKSNGENRHSKNLTNEGDSGEKGLSAVGVEKKQKSGILEIQVNENSDRGYTEKELADISSPSIINADAVECPEDENKEKSEVSDRSTSPLNEETTEGENEGDTETESVESLNSSHDSFCIPRYRYTKGKIGRTRSKDEVDTAPTRARRGVSHLSIEVIPEHSVTKSKKTEKSKVSSGSSDGETSHRMAKSLRTSSLDYIRRKEKLLKKSMTTEASVAATTSGAITGAVTRNTRSRTPEVKLKTEEKVPVRTTPRKITRSAVATEGRDSPSMHSIRLPSSKSHSKSVVAAENGNSSSTQSIRPSKSSSRSAAAAESSESSSTQRLRLHASTKSSSKTQSSDTISHGSTRRSKR